MGRLVSLRIVCWTSAGAMALGVAVVVVEVEKSTGSVCGSMAPKMGFGVTRTVGRWGVGWRMVVFPERELQTIIWNEIHVEILTLR